MGACTAWTPATGGSTEWNTPGVGSTDWTGAPAASGAWIPANLPCGELLLTASPSTYLVAADGAFLTAVE